MSSGVLWFCTAVAFLVFEMLTMTFVLFFFAIGAFASAFFCLFNDNNIIAFFIFSVVSAFSIIFFRAKILNKLYKRNRVISKNILVSQDIQYEKPLQTGRIGIVNKEILPGAVGEITLGGSFWRAISHEKLAEGTSVRITGHDLNNDLLLQVTRYESKQSE